MLEVSRHAKRRLRERLGIPYRAASRVAEQALETGHHPRNYPRPFRKWLEARCQTHTTFVRYFQGAAWVFDYNLYPTITLKTVIRPRSDLRRYASPTVKEQPPNAKRKPRPGLPNPTDQADHALTEGSPRPWL